MTFSYNGSGELVVSETFTDTRYSYAIASYTGGIPAGESLKTGTAQGVLVTYKRVNTPSAGPTTLNWTIPQFADGTGSALAFGVTFFLMREGNVGSDGSEKNDDTKYP